MCVQQNDVIADTRMFDEGRHYRAKIGFVLLSTEQTIEENMFRLVPENVGIHFTRAANPDSITVQSLSKQADDLARAASTLLPDGSLDVICYGCTSGSLVIGEDKVFAELNKGAPKAKATSLITGVIRALKTFEATRLVVATPYLDEINMLEKQYLEAQGFEVVAIEGMNLEKDSDMIRVRPDYLFDFVKELDQTDAQALFISCGALRSLDIVDALEQKVGKPVVCSNQAMAWDVLRLAGIDDQVTGFGSLLSNH